MLRQCSTVAWSSIPPPAAVPGQVASWGGRRDRTSLVPAHRHLPRSGRCGDDTGRPLPAPDDGLEGAQTLVLSGFAKVGPKKANYREWRVTCVASSGNKPVGKPYVQRIWYLPKSKILVVDEWSTPGLAEVLANARWS